MEVAALGSKASWLLALHFLATRFVQASLCCFLHRHGPRAFLHCESCCPCAWGHAFFCACPRLCRSHAFYKVLDIFVRYAGYCVYWFLCGQTQCLYFMHASGSYNHVQSADSEMLASTVGPRPEIASCWSRKHLFSVCQAHIS